MRFVVSTIGTSILTNLIDNTNPEEATWRSVLSGSANLRQNELISDTQKAVINELAERALNKILEDNVGTNCRISAELNGIYGIYEGRLPQGSPDQHYLICTDTAQGQQTGELIKGFLESKGFTVNIFTPSQLSTRNTRVFATGTKELITWLDNAIPRPGSGWDVIFNLVGGFKSLQGYMQTFGTFYADEIVYIFEGSTDLIRIPRLPIQIDTSVVQEHSTKFAMMSAGGEYPIEKLKGIPETLLQPIEDNGNTLELSTWGKLIWNRTKSSFLTEELLPFPGLIYADSFRTDYDGTHDYAARATLQETLAKVAYTLEKNEGNPYNLATGGLRFERFQRHTNIHRFRITGSIRASCRIEEGGLILVHYGQHEYVDAVSHAPYCRHC